MCVGGRSVAANRCSTIANILGSGSCGIPETIADMPMILCRASRSETEYMHEKVKLGSCVDMCYSKKVNELKL
jgi:hypothetical protein